MDQQHIIDPQNQGTWIAATFILALLALVIALAGIYRNSKTIVATQAEIMVLSKKINQLHGIPSPAAADASAPAHAK